MNEIKEILVQLYAYAGFPRSLNGTNTFMTIMNERRANGIKDEIGKAASPVPADLIRSEYGVNVRSKLAGQESIPPPGGYQLFAPVIDTLFLQKVLDNVQHSH